MSTNTWYGFYQQKMHLMSEDASQFTTMFLRKTVQWVHGDLILLWGTRPLLHPSKRHQPEKIAAGLWFKVCLHIFGWWVHVTLSKVKCPMIGNKEVTLNHLECVSSVLKHVCDHLWGCFRPLLHVKMGSENSQTQKIALFLAKLAHGHASSPMFAWLMDPTEY